MRKGFFMVLCCGTLVAGGCAKKEMVKTEEPMPAVTKPAEPAPPPSAPKEEAKELAKEAPAAPTTVKEEPLQEVAKAEAEVGLDKIYFDYDSYLLTAATRDILTKNAEYLLKKNTSARVQIEGHCDERGSDEYNLALGEKRARAAMDYLVALGVPATRLSFISFGEEKPADPSHDEAAWAKNRRDEFILIK